MDLKKRTIDYDIFCPLLFGNSFFYNITGSVQTVLSEAPDYAGDPPCDTTAADSETAEHA